MHSDAQQGEKMKCGYFGVVFLEVAPQFGLAGAARIAVTRGRCAGPGDA